jgi:hypothetical protein
MPKLTELCVQMEQSLKRCRISKEKAMKMYYQQAGLGLE